MFTLFYMVLAMSRYIPHKRGHILLKGEAWSLDTNRSQNEGPSPWSDTEVLSLWLKIFVQSYLASLAPGATCGLLVDV